MKNDKGLDELDIKCLQQMPLLLDVLATTINNVSNLTSRFYNELDELLKSKIKSKKTWKILIDKDHTYSSRIHPFDEVFDKITGPSKIDCYLKIESSICVKKIFRNQESSFWCFIVYLSNEEENSFSFFFQRKDIATNYGKSFNELEFYKRIETKYEDINFQIEHPENGDKDEFISLVLYEKEFSKNKILEAFTIFKDEIVTPMLDSLK